MVVEMKFNDLTYNISYALLIITALYTLLYAGLAGILLCTSVSLIAAAFLDQFELVVSVSVLFALTYIFYLKPILRKMEPFENLNTSPEILDRVAKMKGNYHQAPQDLKDPYREPAGCYDPSIEGFEDVQPTQPKEGEPSESVSASSKRVQEVDPKEVTKVTSAVLDEQAKKSKDQESEKRDVVSAGGSLFKNGKMPSESADGPMVDAGSTLMKAMNALKPDQIKSLSSDTKQLMDTQKGLIEMFKEMGPALQDGMKMVQTFQGMFGGQGGPVVLG